MEFVNVLLVFIENKFALKYRWTLVIPVKNEISMFKKLQRRKRQPSYNA